MRNLNSYLSLFLAISLFAVIGFSNTNNSKDESFVDANINSFLTHVEHTADENQVTVYSNFLIKENGNIFTIDFMLNENGQYEVLSKDYEDEYYKFNSYSTDQMKSYSFPIAKPQCEILAKV